MPRADRCERFTRILQRVRTDLRGHDLASREHGGEVIERLRRHSTLDVRRLDAPRTEGFDVGHSVDTTGAGDLYVAAWAWGDAMGMEVHDTLRWAALYAALSVRVPTGAGGATKLAEFVAEGTRRGLPAPPSGVIG